MEGRMKERQRLFREQQLREQDAREREQAAADAAAQPGLGDVLVSRFSSHGSRHGTAACAPSEGVEGVEGGAGASDEGVAEETEETTDGEITKEEPSPCNHPDDESGNNRRTTSAEDLSPSSAASSGDGDDGFEEEAIRPRSNQALLLDSIESLEEELLSGVKYDNVPEIETPSESVERAFSKDERPGILTGGTEEPTVTEEEAPSENVEDNVSHDEVPSILRCGMEESNVAEEEAPSENAEDDVLKSEGPKVSSLENDEDDVTKDEGPSICMAGIERSVRDLVEDIEVSLSNDSLSTSSNEDTSLSGGENVEESQEKPSPVDVEQVIDEMRSSEENSEGMEGHLLLPTADASSHPSAKEGEDGPSSSASSKEETILSGTENVGEMKEKSGLIDIGQVKQDFPPPSEDYERQSSDENTEEMTEDLPPPTDDASSSSGAKESKYRPISPSASSKADSSLSCEEPPTKDKIDNDDYGNGNVASTIDLPPASIAYKSLGKEETSGSDDETISYQEFLRVVHHASIDGFSKNEEENDSEVDSFDNQEIPVTAGRI